MLLCASVRQHISRTTSPNYTKFSVPSLCPTLAALQYVMYFRFCGLRFPVIGPMAQVTQVGCNQQVTHQGAARIKHDTQNDATRVAADQGRSLMLTVALDVNKMCSEIPNTNALLYVSATHLYCRMKLDHILHFYYASVIRLQRCQTSISVTNRSIGCRVHYR